MPFSVFRHLRRSSALSFAWLFALAISAPALAQQQRPAPRPAAPAPAAPAQPGQAPAASAPENGIVQLKPEPSQPDWVKICGKDPQANTEICYTTRDFVSDQGQPVLAVAIYDVKGKPEKPARFILPLGLMLAPGIRFGVDQGAAVEGKFVICMPNGCFTEGMINDAFIAGMKRGTTLNVKFKNQVNNEVTFQVPLAGFGKAYDGAPLDPKVLAEQQQKLQDELKQRADELRQKLQGESSSATTPPKQ